MVMTSSVAIINARAASKSTITSIGESDEVSVASKNRMVSPESLVTAPAVRDEDVAPTMSVKDRIRAINLEKKGKSSASTAPTLQRWTGLPSPKSYGGKPVENHLTLSPSSSTSVSTATFSVPSTESTLTGRRKTFGSARAGNRPEKSHASVTTALQGKSDESRVDTRTTDKENLSHPVHTRKGSDISSDETNKDLHVVIPLPSLGVETTGKTARGTPAVKKPSTSERAKSSPVLGARKMEVTSSRSKLISMAKEKKRTESTENETKASRIRGKSDSDIQDNPRLTEERGSPTSWSGENKKSDYDARVFKGSSRTASHRDLSPTSQACSAAIEDDRERVSPTAFERTVDDRSRDEPPASPVPVHVPLPVEEPRKDFVDNVPTNTSAVISFWRRRKVNSRGAPETVRLKEATQQPRQLPVANERKRTLSAAIDFEDEDLEAAATAGDEDWDQPRMSKQPGTPEMMEGDRRRETEAIEKSEKPENSDDDSVTRYSDPQKSFASERISTKGEGGAETTAGVTDLKFCPSVNTPATKKEVRSETPATALLDDSSPTSTDGRRTSDQDITVRRLEHVLDDSDELSADADESPKRGETVPGLADDVDNMTNNEGEKGVASLDQQKSALVVEKAESKSQPLDRLVYKKEETAKLDDIVRRAVEGVLQTVDLETSCAVVSESNSIGGSSSKTAGAKQRKTNEHISNVQIASDIDANTDANAVALATVMTAMKRGNSSSTRPLTSHATKAGAEQQRPTAQVQSGIPQCDPQQSVSRTVPKSVSPETKRKVMEKRRRKTLRMLKTPMRENGASAGEGLTRTGSETRLASVGTRSSSSRSLGSISYSDKIDNGTREMTRATQPKESHEGAPMQHQSSANLVSSLNEHSTQSPRKPLLSTISPRAREHHAPTTSEVRGPFKPAMDSTSSRPEGSSTPVRRISGTPERVLRRGGVSEKQLTPKTTNKRLPKDDIFLASSPYVAQETQSETALLKDSAEIHSSTASALASRATKMLRGRRRPVPKTEEVDNDIATDSAQKISPSQISQVGNTSVGEDPVDVICREPTDTKVSKPPVVDPIPKDEEVGFRTTGLTEQNPTHGVSFNHNLQPRNLSPILDDCATHPIDRNSSRDESTSCKGYPHDASARSRRRSAALSCSSSREQHSSCADESSTGRHSPEGTSVGDCTYSGSSFYTDPSAMSITSTDTARWKTSSTKQSERTVKSSNAPTTGGSSSESDIFVMMGNMYKRWNIDRIATDLKKTVAEGFEEGAMRVTEIATKEINFPDLRLPRKAPGRGDVVTPRKKNSKGRSLSLPRRSMDPFASGGNTDFQEEEIAIEVEYIEDSCESDGECDDSNIFSDVVSEADTEVIPDEDGLCEF